MEIGSVFPGNEDWEYDAKGRDLISGLPKMVTIRRSELVATLCDIAGSIVREIHSVIEKTPPELVGDIRENGIILTGGGSLLHGLEDLIATGTRVHARVAENAVECVALGTAKSFDYLDQLYDGFVHTPTYKH